MPPELRGSGPIHDSRFTYGPANIVANFNDLHITEARAISTHLPRELRPEGDPRAVQEIVTAIETAGGQIPFSEYMRLALYGRGGYYADGKVAFQQNGSGMGDFETAPEKSFDFSRALVVGVCALWDATGKKPFNLVEVGGGSGRMAKDMLSTFRNEQSEAYSNLEYFINDFDGMKPRQQETIGSSQGAHVGSYALTSGEEGHAQDLAKVTWLDAASETALQELDNGRPTIVVANEVPDAAPADIVSNVDGVLRQKMVAFDGTYFTEQWGELTPEVQDYIERYGVAVPVGQETAISVEALALQQKITHTPGFAAFINIDYGQFGPAFYDTEPWQPAPVSISGASGRPHGQWWTEAPLRTYPRGFHPLQMAGELDITYNPDFNAHRQAAEEEQLRTVFAGTQESFIEVCGMPNSRTMFAIREEIDSFFSEASKRRIDRARELFADRFQVLVVTNLTGVDFETPKPLLSGYDELVKLVGHRS